MPCFRRTVHCCLVLTLILLLSTALYAASPYVWLEGEAPKSIIPSDIKPEITDVGRPSYLSSGKWLHISIDPSNVDKTVPDTGIILSYSFNSAAGSYELWNRIGYEAVRSSFDWRIDNGPWSTIKSDAPSTDIMQLQTWNPVAWLQMGSTTLPAGAHTLQIRITKSKDNKGSFAAVQYASDALCIDPIPFHPNGPYQPGDTTWQTDRDKAAASKVFSVEAPESTAQIQIPLSGDWQMARYDEDTIHDPDGPVASTPHPDDLYWKAIPVPGNRDDAHPEWLYSHRYWLRSRVSLPSNLDGKSFYLHFPALSMLATIFVNGKQCGFDNTPFAAWDCDVTNAIKPGQVNEIWIGIKDWYYALPDYGAKEGGHLQYIPTDWVTKFGLASFTYPVWNHTANGIIRPPTLVIAGSAYTSDVFAEPSVRSKTLGLQITIYNPSSQAVTVQVTNNISLLAGGAPEKTFAPKEVSIPSGQDTVVNLSETWPSPKLWWPDSPAQYIISTRLAANGKDIDECKTKFGFREWGWTGAQFTLNGVPFHGHADLVDYGRADESAVALWRAHGQNMQRMWGEDTFSGLYPEEALDFYDSHGIPIRRTGIFDGEAARYHLETPGLFDHWRAQLSAWIKGQRNHPSIFIWSMENEITFINGHVTGQDDITTREMKKAADTVAAIDPTRPMMTDGGNALLDQSLPVYGGHYMEPAFQTLPAGAYDKTAFAHRQVWPITQVKPILLGEAFYASGNEPEDFATVGGEEAFLGKAESHPAIGLTAKMLSEGYRWNGVNFQFWIGGESEAYYNSWQPIVVLCRQWDSTFSSGQEVKRTLNLFNDTHYSMPITLSWTLNIGGKAISKDSAVHHVAPGMNEIFDVTLSMPHVAARTDGTWTLTLIQDGKEVFKDAKAITVMPSVSTPAAVAVYDPSGNVTSYLQSRKIAFTPVKNLGQAPNAKVLIVGPNALTQSQSTSSSLSAYASSGRTVIVLEQKTPLRYQGLPGMMQTDTNSGDIAFAEDLTNPIFHGLAQHDFFTWGDDGQIYANAYVKPTSGGRSLVQCDWRLGDSALVQMPAGKGQLLLCQLLVGQKLNQSAVAQTLLSNMIAYGQSYRQVFRPVTVTAVDDISLTKALDSAGLQYAPSEDVLSALSKPTSILVISATPAHLHTLAANQAKVEAFMHGGGWIIFNNLTTEGLADYDSIVCFQHMIRPFKQEKVSFASSPAPLLSGLSASDIVMGSGKQIFDWAAGQYPDTNAYSYVVDIDDIAPFATSSFFAWDNITNNYTMADGYWPLIINFPAPKDGSPFQAPISWPSAQTIDKFTFVGDNNYYPQTKLALVFPNGDRLDYNYDHGDPTKPAEPQTYEINPPKTVKSLTLEITGWDALPTAGPNIGIDNIYFYAKRPDDFSRKVVPLLNIGAMVEYPRGAGGIVLCNVKFQSSEANPENAGKKQAIITTILKNLNAPFSGGKSIIAGAADLTYTPIDISKQANQYRNEQGWFGDNNFTFADLPAGRQTYAGVPYNIYNFTTSPVPTVIMLGGSGVAGNLPDHVEGIPVGRKADALFFLQAARIDNPRNPDEVKNDRQFEMADYMVHYADGQTVKVPIYAEISVDNYKQATPAALPGAQIAWSKPYGATGQSAVAYSMQWNNPRPNVAIQTIDLVYGPDRRGIPALLAVTAATGP